MNLSQKLLDTLNMVSKIDFDSFLVKMENRSLEDRIGFIKNLYKEEKLVFVLGAGSSISYGLPSWNTLLQKLFLITLQNDSVLEEKEKMTVVAKTFTSIFNPNALISARYLNDYFKKKHPSAELAFENAIRDNLYENVESENDSELLKEIRQFCIAAGRNPNIDSIITYNYDDIIEECLKNIDVDIPFSSIYSRGMSFEKYKLPIYHVHGYLPRHGNLTKKNKVVLSENEYHQQYTDTYSWSNLTQINKFKDSNCLFIGVSFSDPNLRRLLDIAKNERGNDEIHHFCFKKRYKEKDVKEKLEKLLESNNELLDEKNVLNLGVNKTVRELIKLVEVFEENDAASFGVSLIWVNEYDEIPDILKKIRVNT